MAPPKATIAGSSIDIIEIFLEPITPARRGSLREPQTTKGVLGVVDPSPKPLFVSYLGVTLVLSLLCAARCCTPNDALMLGPAATGGSLRAS